MDAEKPENEFEAPADKLEGSVHHLPRPLNIEEKKYLLAVERGDLPNVKRFLQIASKGHVNGKSVDVNCVDSLGRGALTLAIESENLEMVELLIVMGVDTRDALLHAIDQEFVEAVELLLEHEELMMNNEINAGELDKEISHSWQRIDPTLARFSAEMTPLVLAAQRNNYEILKLLLDRGATLPMPHDIRCGCEDCLKSATEDPLKFSSTRISEYKALSSPSLIALSSPDPLLTAFQLSWELRELASAEPESKSEYMKLRQQVEKFAVDLLQQIRNTSELNTILNYDPQVNEDLPTKPLARLEQAIQYKQKRFVAHSHVQQLLSAIWYEGVPGFRRMSASRKVYIVVKTALLFPFYCLLYFLAPESKTGRLMRRPFMKFLVHAASYVFFLFVLILVSQRAEVEVVKFFGSEESRRNVENDLARQRGAGPSPLESIVLIYVLGFIWQETREVYVDGLKAYLRDMWNFIDFTRNTLYVGTGILRIAAYLQQKAEIQMDSSAAMIPRENWPDFDPQLIAEGLFAAANIFSALKLVHLFSINPHLGPLQISLGKMVIDIVKFFFIYTLVLFSFACGLNQLLWYFAELEKRKCYSDIANPLWDAASDACIRWRRFSSLFESCQSLFWASFGGIGIDSFELSGIKSYTRFWGLLMFGSYSVINVIVLLNLLIAMMSNSYAIIEQDADTEWKFARSKLWMSYFEEGETLPPPFNIFPSPKRFLRMCGFQKKSDNGKNSARRLAREHKYETVMRALIWRYVVNAHSEQVREPVTEDDVHELKSDLSSWRCELLDILQRNGMDISGIDAKEKTVLGKKMKMWERRLMKDFQVTGSFDAGNDQTQETFDIQPVEGEDNITRWRRIAKLAVLQSAGRRWGQVVSSAVKSSQIGKGNSKASLQSKKSLKRAMEEARRLSSKSPLPPVSPIELPESTAATILHVLKDIVEDDASVDHWRTYLDPPTLCVTPDPTSPIIHPEPVTAVGYIDEINKNSPPSLPPYTPAKKPRRTEPKSPSSNYPKINNSCASDMTNARAQFSPVESHTLHVPACDTLSNSSTSPNRMQKKTLRAEMNMPEMSLSRLKLRASISPRRIVPSSDSKCQKGNDKQKFLNITPKSPRYSNSKSPKRGGWL